MEKTCPYCHSVFTVKRMDALYCSHSCRQMAYIERKTEHTGKSTLSGNQTDSEALNHNHTRETESPEPTLTYRTEEDDEPELNSKSAFLDALNELADKCRDDDDALDICINHYDDSASYQVAEDLRCLTECALMLSEARQVKTSDLMELCNAFTHLIYSDAYNNLPEAFPYTDYIASFKGKLRKLCLEVRHSQEVRFTLMRRDKIRMILIRFQLSDYVPKKTFRRLQAEQTEEHQEKHRRKNK